MFLDLDTFNGPVYIYGSTFTLNKVGYKNCDVALNMQSSTNSFTDHYSNFGTKSTLLIKSLISIVKHSYLIDILGNTFS